MDFIAGLSEWGYIGLFIAGFLAGSILPFSSEVVLGLLLYAGYNEWGCLASATAGNWLGGVTCYYIGRLGKVEWIEKYLRIKKSSLDKTQKFLQGKGSSDGFFRLSSCRRRSDHRHIRAYACQCTYYKFIDACRQIPPLLLCCQRHRLLYVDFKCLSKFYPESTLKSSLSENLNSLLHH